MEVNFWPATSGRFPVYEFIEEQPPDAKQRIMKTVDHLSEKGLSLLANKNKMKALRGYTNLYELRINFKGVCYRILLCVIKGRIWLLDAFKKKSNSTPFANIKKALQRRETLAY